MLKKYIDLHLHLDGAITVEIARKLAQLQEIDIPDSDSELKKIISVSNDCESLNDFLKCFEFPLSLLQTKKSISEAVYLVQENIKSQNVEYAEIRFAPQLHTNNGLTMREVIEAALDGLHKSDLKCNLLLCCMRGSNTHKLNMETVKLAKEFLINDITEEKFGVVGIDLAGAEGIFKTNEYEKEFSLAKSFNIPITIHAGEADGPESVYKAIEFGAKRIGHGIRAIEDDKLLKRIADNQIVLELCPTSNRQTKAIENMDKYPLQKFLEKGIKVTINTDDMAISDTTIQKEFEYIQEKFGITLEQKRQIYVNSVEGSFAGTVTKNKLLNYI